MLWSCILGRWLATLRTFVYFWLGIGIALGIILALVVILGGEITAGPLLIFFGVVLLALIAFLIWDLIQCLVSPTTPPPQAPPLPGALTSAVDCPTAQQMLNESRAKAAQLQAELDAQIARVAAAQQAVNVARMSLTAATSALAVTFFAPWLIPAALAAVAAATYMTYQRAKALENELAKLESLANQFGAAQRDIAANEMLVAQSCAAPATPPTVTVPGTVGLTTGAIQLIARGRGRCRSAASSGTPTQA